MCGVPGADCPSGCRFHITPRGVGGSRSRNWEREKKCSKSHKTSNASVLDSLQLTVLLFAFIYAYIVYKKYVYILYCIKVRTVDICKSQFSLQYTYSMVATMSDYYVSGVMVVKSEVLKTWVSVSFINTLAAEMNRLQEKVLLYRTLVIT